MNEISVLNNKIFRAELQLQRERLGDHLCTWYSMATPREKTDDKKICLSKFPYYVGAIIEILSRHHIVPKYWCWWGKLVACDIVFSSKIANDESKVIYVPIPCKRTIRKAKKKGKKVVLLLANSEPRREYERIVGEYDRYGIKNRYIYGDKQYQFSLVKTIPEADNYINITEVSRKTYANAGYDMSKSKLILDTGTNMPKQLADDYQGKQKAFISTAFHSFIKGTHRLLLAWKKAGIKDIPLLLVGKMCEDMQEFIDKNGPFENVVFVGHCANLKDWYKQYDAMGVILSLSEGSGRVTPEMMSFGFPMIVSPDAVCDLIKEGYNGSIVEPTDEDAIAEKLRYYAEDWERVHAMRGNALNSLNRTVNDYAIEIADYLISLSGAEK